MNPSSDTCLRSALYTDACLPLAATLIQLRHNIKGRFDSFLFGIWKLSTIRSVAVCFLLLIWLRVGYDSIWKRTCIVCILLYYSTQHCHGYSDWCRIPARVDKFGVCSFILYFSTQYWRYFFFLQYRPI